MEIEIRKTYHSNGNLGYEESYVNGIKHGIQKYYTDFGILEKESNFKNGIHHGLHQHWNWNKTRYCINSLKGMYTIHSVHIIFNY